MLNTRRLGRQGRIGGDLVTGGALRYNPVWEKLSKQGCGEGTVQPVMEYRLAADTSPRRGRQRGWRGLWAMMIGVIALGLLASVGIAAAGGLALQAATPSPQSPVEAVIAVDRAPVFSQPDRNAEPFTTLFQRERVPVFGQTPDGVFLLTAVDAVQGWILRAQVDLTGDTTLIPVVSGTQPAPTVTFTPFVASPTPGGRATRTPLPTGTPTSAPTNSPAPVLTPTTLPAAETPVATLPAGASSELPAVVPGVPPPLEITLPDDWKAVHVEVPFRAFDGQVYSVPLSVYTGPLPGGVTGYVYLYWGFPNVVDFDGNYNPWADGVQLLRGSLIGESCNLGIDQQMTFRVGAYEGVGTFYAAVSCESETDTAGWFAALRVDEGSYAFFTAVEPFSALADQIAPLQAILDSIVFLPPDVSPN